MPPVITIDGPSGTGKSTIASRVAQELGWHLLDSGALYRVVALVAAIRGLSFDDEGTLAELANKLDVCFVNDAGTDRVRVLCEGEDLSDAIRGEVCGNDASRVAAFQSVRRALLRHQRDARRAPGLVADGRDMGTVVFPDAIVKIFLTASPQARGKRRYKQLKGKGIDVSLANLLAEIAKRDERDRSRVVSPLKAAEDAVIVDTTSLDMSGVLRQVMDIVHEHVPKSD